MARPPARRDQVPHPRWHGMKVRRAPVARGCAIGPSDRWRRFEARGRTRHGGIVRDGEEDQKMIRDEMRPQKHRFCSIERAKPHFPDERALGIHCPAGDARIAERGHRPGRAPPGSGRLRGPVRGRGPLARSSGKQSPGLFSDPPYSSKASSRAGCAGSTSSSPTTTAACALPAFAVASGARTSGATTGNCSNRWRTMAHRPRWCHLAALPVPSGPERHPEVVAGFRTSC